MNKNTYEEARSGQPETRELVEGMIFDEPERTGGTVQPVGVSERSKSEVLFYSDIIDVPAGADGLVPGMLFDPMEFLETTEKTGVPTEAANPDEQESTIYPLDFLSGFIKCTEDKCEIDLTKGLSVPLGEEKSLIALPQQMWSQTKGIQARRQDVVKVIGASSAKPTAYDTAIEMISKTHLLTINSCLYKHNGVYYAPLQEEEARREIVGVCREDVAAVGSPNFEKSVYDMLLDLPELEQRGLEANQGVVSFQNGALLFNAGMLVPNSPSLFTTYGLQCNYLGGSPASPQFDNFLLEVTGGDIELIERIWQMIGYVLSPDTRGKVFFLLQGVPNSGKSVLSALLSSFFNEKAVFSLDAHDLSARFAVSDLMGKALCISPDMPSGALDKKTVSKLKQLTGNDVVSADVKYKDRVQFRNTAKIVLASNHPLIIKGSDEAFFERVVVVPFNYSTPKEMQDVNLLERLKAERDAIATRAISAYYRLVKQKYRFSGQYRINECVDTYSQGGISSGDVTSGIYGFLKSCFIRDETSIVYVKDAHRLFTEMYGVIAINTFSQDFVNFANQLYGGVHDRKRKPGEKNPTSCVKGIRFVGEEGQM